MIVTDDTWFMVRNTPLVTGFLGSSGGGAKPVPVSTEEMQTIFDLMGIKEEDNTEFTGEVGDQVEIISGSFKGSEGIIESIDLSKKVVTVLISMFGRTTPAELSLSDVKVIK
jgi:transcriptional antiterminator NusG